MSHIFPSPADGAMDSTKADLEDMSAEESDPLPPLQSLKSHPPKRPPPPRSSSAPSHMSSHPPQAPFPQPSSYTSIPSQSPSSSPNTGPRQKIPPLKSHEIRWFYEEPGKAWTPFNGHDSLSLEECYLRWQTDRSSMEGLDVSVMGDMYEANIREKVCQPIYWSTKQTWRIMRGMWFEVCGEKWYPLEEQDSARVELEHCRVGWRNRASEAQQLKRQSGPAEPNKATDVVMNKLSLEKYDVLWMADETIFRMKKEITSQLWNIVGEKLGKGQTYGCSKLQRGYKEAASHENREPPIGHLVLIVHGIGQNMDMSDISKDTSSFRSACAQVGKKHFPDDWSQKRVEFLPCEWRTWLTLDKGILSTITPHSLKKMRGIINDTIIDVMYYMSYKYGPEIMDGLRFSMHKQYNEFMKRNPNFNGTVSIFAHSLGSVMVYDLLLETCKDRGVEHIDVETKAGANEATPTSHKKPAVELHNAREVKFNPSSSSMQSSYSRPIGQDETGFKVGREGGVDEVDRAVQAEWNRDSARMELEQLQRRVAELEAQLGIRKARGLDFKVDHFFAVGSPLPLFLLMREHDCLIKKGHRGAASLLPTCICKRVHNVHHPSDPIAYRLEPLVNELYTNVKPVKLDSAGSKPSKESVDLAQGPREEKAPVANKGWFNLFSSSKKTEPTQTKVPEKVVDDDKTLRVEDRLKERLDFMLRESITENSYISSLTAHLSYWSSQDCAQYVLLQIYSYKSTDSQ